MFFSTAKGVEHFKTGNYDTALKYFKHALQIDGKNVEAMVAQGALWVNYSFSISVSCLLEVSF